VNGDDPLHIQMQTLDVVQEDEVVGIDRIRSRATDDPPTNDLFNMEPLP